MIVRPIAPLRCAWDNYLESTSYGVCSPYVGEDSGRGLKNGEHAEVYFAEYMHEARIWGDLGNMLLLSVRIANHIISL